MKAAFLPNLPVRVPVPVRPIVMRPVGTVGADRHIPPGPASSRHASALGQTSTHWTGRARSGHREDPSQSQSQSQMSTDASEPAAEAEALQGNFPAVNIAPANKPSPPAKKVSTKDGEAALAFLKAAAARWDSSLLSSTNIVVKVKFICTYVRTYSFD